MIGTFWALVPAIVAIVLALITKEVYSSLFTGILIGAAFFAGSAAGGFTIGTFIEQVLNKGLIAQLADPYNAGILVFLVMLGIIVVLLNKTGGSAAFGQWAKTHIKTKCGAQLATIFLGILIFIDDYFNCLTVGSVMKPITDKHKISREKLAYLIDSTAAPICIIAPISSWAAAVSGFVKEGENGLALFVNAIPYNFYALLTIVMLFALVIFKIDFGSMNKFELAAETLSNKKSQEEDSSDGAQKNALVRDLIIPIAVLIILCVLGMIYSGGFFASGKSTYLNFINSFAASDASVGLVIGSTATLIFCVIYFMARRLLSFTECMQSIPEGFKAMVPAILILALAWTLKGMTESLGAKQFVAGVVEQGASGFKLFLPAIVFLIACGLAFATGTSWGTFGILIPICIAVFPEAGDPLHIISISACMAGAVCGDHCSPISDTTIMASAGAQCNHVNHVSTQLPYALTVAAISFVCYIIAGVVQNAVVPLLFGLAAVIATLIIIKALREKN
ncbi:Na+/H+ antiporter NhaC family protein [Treponema sp.]|uniref:Na+/H+ antiporter NhaC family protein n=1 Tax=Treponema sp. TaxID=166 RepID=UPI00298E489A|nr:Na+/H+ antiporter NhaC family protein [Treponema sp.]